MATSDRLEPNKEQGVIKDGGASRTKVGSLLPVDLPALPPQIEKSGAAKRRDRPRVAPDNVGEVSLLEFPSEEKDDRNQAVDPSVVPAPSVPNAARPSMLVIEPWDQSVERDDTPSMVEPGPVIEHRLDSAAAVLSLPFASVSLDRFHLAAASRSLAIRRAFGTSMSAVMQSSGYVWRMGGWSLIKTYRAGRASLIAVTRAILRKIRVAGQAFPASVEHVRARYRFRHPRIPVRMRPAIGQDMRRALAPFVCGVAVGVASVLLLVPRVPSVMTFAMRLGGAAPALDEMRSSAAKVPEAPIVLAASLPAGASSAADVQPTTAAPRPREDVRQTALTAAGRFSVAGPAAAPSSDRTAGMVGRRSSDPNRADGSAPARRPPAAPRPAPVPRFLGSLAVSSSPPGAQVFINGVSVGVTPLVLSSMPVGSRAVRVELGGHRRWSSAVRIVADERTLVEARLLPSSTQ